MTLPREKDVCDCRTFDGQHLTEHCEAERTYQYNRRAEKRALGFTLSDPLENTRGLA